MALPRVAFSTLGCKVNQSETDLFVRRFRDAGYECVGFEDHADVYVVNTCTVTHVADRKSRQTLRQIRRTNPSSLVVATGCYASIVGEMLADEMTLVVRNRDKDRLLEIVEGRRGRSPASTPSYIDEEKYESGPSRHYRTRSMVKVQDGCDSHCTYCIIPRARGRSRSVSPHEVVTRVKGLSIEGHSEVVITGVDLGSYGEDVGTYPDLGGLVRRVLGETDVRRVRLSSLEPGDFKVEWLDLWKDPRLCRHLHVPLQAGSAGVLQRMERRYTPDEFTQMLCSCRSAIDGLTVTTDVMVGFPGETDEEFQEGLAFIRSMSFDGMHVFKYSPRGGTRAARLQDVVDHEVKSRRSASLREEAEAGTARLLDRHLGEVHAVAWERDHDGLARGVTDTNVRVYASPAEVVHGSLRKVRLSSPFRDGLWGEGPQVEIPLFHVS